MTREDAKSPKEVIRLTYEWGGRKEQFTERQILLAQEVLGELGWVGSADAAPGP